MVRRVGRARREVHEERLVRHQRLLLADPADRLVGEILRQVVALLGGQVGLDGRRAVIQRGRVLVRLAADEPVEVLEAAADARPCGERTHRAGLPDGDLVALAELRRGVTIELQRLGQRGARVRADRAIAWRRCGDLRDAAHPHGVVIPTAQQRGTRRRAQGRRVEARVLQAFGGETLERRCPARPAERAVRAEAGVIDEDDEHVRRPVRRPDRLDPRKRSLRVLRVVRRDTGVRPVRDRQDRPTGFVDAHGWSPFRGVGHARPKRCPVAAQATSELSSTFGAPVGARSGSGNAPVESFSASSIVPVNGGSAGGRTVRSGVNPSFGTSCSPLQVGAIRRQIRMPGPSHVRLSTDSDAEDAGPHSVGHRTSPHRASNGGAISGLPGRLSPALRPMVAEQRVVVGRCVPAHPER